MRREIRIALPSKGRLEQDALEFLAAAGLRVYKPNPRQYLASIPALPEVSVVFQRPGDIVVSVREGSVDFGLTGFDVVAERGGPDGALYVLHEALGFGSCKLALAVPEEWQADRLAEVGARAQALGHALRVATKYPTVTRAFLDRHGLAPYTLIDAEGTLEVAPTLGYADAIVDLVSSGQTLRDNRLLAVRDGVVLESQAVLIANRQALQARSDVRRIAHQLLEYVEAHLRGEENYMIFVNVRDADPASIAARLFARPDLGGLQGPTIAPIHTRGGELWHSVSIVVHKERLIPAVRALREIGGSGVIVTPVTYIFEEEPARAVRLTAEFGG